MMVGKRRFNPVGALARPVAARPPIASQWANPNTDKWIQLSQVLHCVLSQPVGRAYSIEILRFPAQLRC